MKYAVQVTEDAGADLAEIHAYIASQDGLMRAGAVLDAITAAALKLASFPLRGEYPPELLELGIRAFRQVHHKPYRIIYQVSEDAVQLLVIADGRRDMQALLQRRLLAG